MLEVRFLGTFSIRYDGEPVVIGSRAGQSLFAYLILNAGTPHRREKLAGLFWPDTTEEKARAYLRHELWRIRKALSRCSSEGVIASDEISLSINRLTPYWVDVTVLVDTSDDAPIETIMHALSLFKGELLPGFYDEWVVLEREHVQAVYEHKLARLLKRMEGERRWHDMLDWAERWISLSRSLEAAYQALMVAYAALGDHAKVASTYDRCVQALRALDLQPSEETRALATQRRRSLHIPIPLTSFIGREREIQEVSELLSRNRLVTLTGAGGVGKTRLSIQVAAEVLDRFPDGVWFLDLAPLQDPELIPNTLARLLGLSESSDANLSITDQLINYFRSCTALIIFDNCEHLIESAAGLVHALLSLCEGLSILATSREGLRVAGEIPYRVPSLEIPKIGAGIGIQTVEKIESVQLFTQRAAADSPGFTMTPHNVVAIAQICQRLDGIPLAIELAAARTSVLDVEQILTRLDDRFKLLTGGTRTALPRQKTLWATIEWSYSLLPENEKILFRRLAVFTGGWTLEAGEKICSGEGIQAGEVLDLLSQLVNKSLVVVGKPETGIRYRRLEIIREFAREKLIEATEAGRLQDRHLGYFLELAEQADKEIHGPNQIEWLDQLESEHDNLRAALGWCVSRQNTEAGLRLLGALAWAWSIRDHFSEVSSWLERIRSLPNISRSPALYARLLNHMADHSGLVGDTQQARSFLEESRALWLKVGAKGEVGLAGCLNLLGRMAATDKANTETARALLEQSLALYEKHGDEWGIARVLSDWGKLLFVEGEYAQAEAQSSRSLAKFQELGDHFMSAMELSGMGELARFMDDYERARQFHEQNLEIFRKLRGRFALAWPFVNLAWVYLRQGDERKARALFEDSLKLFTESNNKFMVATCLAGFASVMASKGRLENAAQLFGAAEHFLESFSPLEPADQKDLDYYLELVRNELHRTTLATAWAKGRTMTLEQAISFALRES